MCRSRSRSPIRLRDAQAVVDLQKKTGLVAMCGHTRRFNPSHQWVHKKIVAGEFNIQQMDVQTFFFRRTNMNALGQPRSWTDHLLWHHAAHTVDLFAYQARSPIVKANALQGPIHPTLGIAMDMSIQLKAANGAICTLSLSFNNDGPLGTFFRYIGDTGTYLARYDDLFNGKDEKIDVSKVDVSMNGIELQDREFFAAIRRGPRAELERRPGAAVLSGAARAGAAARRLTRSVAAPSRLQLQFAQEIAFSKRCALVTKNVVGRGGMEKEVRQRNSASRDVGMRYNCSK